MMHSDDIRMRMLLPGETAVEYERLSGSYHRERKKLYWWVSEFEPLTFAFYPRTSRLAQAAFFKAMHYMEHDVGCRLFEDDHDEGTGAQVILGECDLESYSDGFTRSGSQTGFRFEPEDENEQGYCDFKWDDDGRVIEANAYIDADLSWFDMWRVAAHELGHVLLLGHDKQVPGRLMHVVYGGVGRLKPMERKWLRQIHNLPGKK